MRLANNSARAHNFKEEKMKQILVAFFIALLASACSSSVRNVAVPQSHQESERGVCESGDADADLACYRAQLKSARQSLDSASSRLNELQSKAKSSEENNLPPLLRPPPRPMQLRRIVAPRTTRGGCVNGYNISIVNMTPHFFAVTAAAIVPCGPSYLVQQWVEYPSGESDLIWLIPPSGSGGNVGNFYFDPDAGGDGPQDYLVTAYSQSSISGMSADHPRRATGKKFVGRAEVPWERGGGWGVVKIFPTDLH